MFRTSPGRNNLIENLKRNLLKFFRPNAIAGQQRSKSHLNSFRAPELALEIPEYPARSPLLGRSLIEMRHYSREVATALRILTNDAVQSNDGNNIGFRVGKLDITGKPIDKECFEICGMAIASLLNAGVIKQILENMLIYGDCFLNVGIDRTGETYEISKLLKLPCWEMFRLESDKGELLGFEQRGYVWDGAPIKFEYPQIVHFRFQTDFLYGQSLWKQSTDDWQDVRAATKDLATACRALGINPNVHTMPPGYNKQQLDEYINAYEGKLEDGIVPDFYMASGGSVAKLANFNPNLEPLIRRLLDSRKQLLMPSLIPLWRLPGLFEGAGGTASGQDISGQPSLAYTRWINSIRGDMSEGIKQILDTQLILIKGFDWWRNKAKDKYVIEWPQWAQNIQQEEKPKPTNSNGNGTKKAYTTSEYLALEN